MIPCIPSNYMKANVIFFGDTEMNRKCNIFRNREIKSKCYVFRDREIKSKSGNFTGAYARKTKIPAVNILRGFFRFCAYLIFFIRTFTVGAGNKPARHRQKAVFVGFTTGMELHQSPKDLFSEK